VSLRTSSAERHRQLRQALLLHGLGFTILAIGEGKKPNRTASGLPDLSVSLRRYTTWTSPDFPGMSAERIKEVWGPGSKRHVEAVGARHDGGVWVEIEDGDLERLPCLADVVTPTLRTRSGSIHMWFVADERISGKINRDGIEIASGPGSQSLVVAPDRDWLKGREPWAVGLAPCPEEVVQYWLAAKKPDPVPRPKRTVSSSPSGLVCADDQILLDRYGLAVGPCLCRHHDDHSPSANVFHGQDDGRLLVWCFACRRTWTLAQFVGEKGAPTKQWSKQAYAVAMKAREVFLDRRFANVTLDLPVQDRHYEQALALASLKDVSFDRDDLGDVYAEAMIGFVLTGSTEEANVGKAVLALAKTRGWITSIPCWVATHTSPIARARLRILHIAKWNTGLLRCPRATLALAVRRGQGIEAWVGPLAWAGILPPDVIAERCTGPPVVWTERGWAVDHQGAAAA